MFQLYDFGQQGGDVEERTGAGAGSLLVIAVVVAAVLVGLALIAPVTHALTAVTTIITTVTSTSGYTVYVITDTIVDTISDYDDLGELSNRSYNNCDNSCNIYERQHGYINYDNKCNYRSFGYINNNGFNYCDQYHYGNNNGDNDITGYSYIDNDSYDNFDNDCHSHHGYSYIYCHYFNTLHNFDNDCQHRVDGGRCKRVDSDHGHNRGSDYDNCDAYWHVYSHGDPEHDLDNVQHR